MAGQPGARPGILHARHPEVAPTVSSRRRSRGRKPNQGEDIHVAVDTAQQHQPVVTMKELLAAGVHFGHQTRRWNPKMRRFIFGERNGIYVIDLHQTLERIDTAYRFVRDTVAGGGSVLFVGTKKQAQEPVQRHASRAGMPYVNFRWLGGMLTNFQTVHSRVAKLRELQRQVDSGEVDQMPKKEGLKVRRDLSKLERNLGGIKSLERLPEVVFVIDTKKEHIAVIEARRLGIPIVAVVDTNCDPDIIDYVIPGNDDAIRSAQLMCHVIAQAAVDGRFLASKRNARAGTRAEDVEPAPRPQRSTEEEAAFQARQAEARAQAAAAQAEREQRLQAQRAEAPEAPAAAEAGTTDTTSTDGDANG
jgi:small subunit ribosomal protein S2